MKNYSQNEIQEMQKQAVERVREMQRRSQMTRHAANNDITGAGEQTGDRSRSEPENKNSRPEKRENEARQKIPDIPKHVSLPVNLPEKGKINREQKGGGLSSLLSSLKIDNDTALILSLILLLSGEGADTELILALLYIMF